MLTYSNGWCMTSDGTCAGAEVEERDAAGCTPLQHAVCGMELYRASRAPD